MRIRHDQMGLLALLCAFAAACRSVAPVGAGELGAGSVVPPAVARPQQVRELDVEHYALDIDLDPLTRSVAATCRVRLWPTVDQLRAVELDLEGLDVVSVTDEHGRALTFRHAQGVLRIELAEPLERDDFTELSVRYSGHPRKGLWFARTRDGAATQVFTQGECEDARGWFPCVDSPADRATSQLRVSMPRAWRSVAAGERIERSEAGDRAVELWRMNAPHPPYLMTLVAGEFALREGEWDGVPLWFLSDAAHASDLDATFEKTGDMLGFFSEITGTRYPYAKYSQACVANFPFGGMENISATTLTETTLRDARGRRDSPPTGLVAHEAAHQWFGDLLTCQDWSQIWLNEGWATYMEALYTERSRGVDEFRTRMRDLQDGYVRRDIGPNRRPIVHGVYRDPMDLFFSGHAYDGAATRLHLLRFVLGDVAFFRGVRRYVGENANRAVVTDDLRRAMEASAGVDLTWFFDTWLLKPGFPEFQVAWRYDPRRKLVLLTVNQVQDPADGTPAVFRTPVEVEVRCAGGARVHRLMIENRRELFRLPSEASPTCVRFDKHSWIPKLVDDTKSTSEWLVIATLDDDVNGRRDAIHVLARVLDQGSDEERQSARDALADRLAVDTSSHVRAAAAAALGVRVRPECRAALELAASGDAEARVRVAALAALSAFAPERELRDFALTQYRAGFSWEVMGAAAALVRSAAPERAYEFLSGELFVESPHDVLRGRLIAELAQVNDSRVLPLVRALASDPMASDAARVAAVSALGRLGRGNADVRRELLALLSAESFRVRRETISALGALGDPAVRSPLTDYYRTCGDSRERRAIEAILAPSSNAG